MGQESSVEEYKVVNVKENVTGVAGEENPAFFSFEITEEMKKEEKDVLVSVMVTSGRLQGIYVAKYEKFPSLHRPVLTGEGVCVCDDKNCSRSFSVCFDVNSGMPCEGCTDEDRLYSHKGENGFPTLKENMEQANGSLSVFVPIDDKQWPAGSYTVTVVGTGEFSLSLKQVKPRIEMNKKLKKEEKMEVKDVPESKEEKVKEKEKDEIKIEGAPVKSAPRSSENVEKEESSNQTSIKLEENNTQEKVENRAISKFMKKTEEPILEIITPLALASQHKENGTVSTTTVHSTPQVTKVINVSETHLPSGADILVQEEVTKAVHSHVTSTGAVTTTTTTHKTYKVSTFNSTSST